MEAYYPHSRLKKRWILLIALLLNFILLLLLFIFNSDHSSDILFPKIAHDAPVVFDSPPPTPPAQDDQEDPYEIAALKPRASVFGATELEQEEPEFTRGATDSDSASEDGSGLDVAHEHEKESAEEPPQEKEEDTNKTKEQTKTQQDTPSTTIAKDTSIQEKVAMSMATQNALQHMIKKKSKTATKNNTGRGTKNASPIKKLTFSDLARGFIETFEHEGEDWLKRDGNPNIRPHKKEMKYLSYYRKLAWHVQSTIKQHKITPQSSWPTELVTVLLLEFRRDGTISSATIGKSSNVFEYDYICKDLFDTNNSGYPLIPQHIPEDVITVPVSISLSTRRPRIQFSYL